MYSLVILRGSSYNPAMETADLQASEEVRIAGLLAGDDIAIRVQHEPTRGEVYSACERVLRLVDPVEAGRILASIFFLATEGATAATSWLQHWYVITEGVEPLREFREMLESKGLVTMPYGRATEQRITVRLSRGLAKRLSRHALKADDVVRLLRSGAAKDRADRVRAA